MEPFHLLMTRTGIHKLDSEIHVSGILKTKDRITKTNWASWYIRQDSLDDAARPYLTRTKANQIGRVNSKSGSLHIHHSSDRPSCVLFPLTKTTLSSKFSIKGILIASEKPVPPPPP
ncbi:hypothetical protein STEG23_021311 [Scotinomys teguina]